MRTTFFGLEIGRQALQAHQRALDVTGHNIANASTPGYSRQQAVMSATTPFAMPGLNKPLGPGQLGTGVAVEEVRRMREGFIDGQIRKENRTTGFWTAQQNALEKLEVVLNEPSDSGIRSVMDKFWAALQELTKNPENQSVRSVVRQQGIALTDAFNHANKQMSNLQEDLNASIKIKVDEVNSIGRQIAAINQEIVEIEITGDKANDLRDKRDLLIDQLSTLVDVDVNENNVGAATVMVGGVALVQGKDVYLMQTVDDPLNNGYVNVQWAQSGAPAVLKGGEIKGMIEARGYYDPVTTTIKGVVPDMKKVLDDLAANFITEFNAIHAAGFGLNTAVTGIDFFTGTDAQSIKLAADISDDTLGGLNNIAASSVSTAGGNNGNNDNAIKLAQLKHALTMKIAPTDPVNTATFDDFFRINVANLGVKAQEAERMVSNQEILVSQLENQRQSVSGVSIDEEMTNMIRFQHGYNAAARLVTTVDEMLDTIVNRLGLVGR